MSFLAPGQCFGPFSSSSRTPLIALSQLQQLTPQPQINMSCNIQSSNIIIDFGQIIATNYNANIVSKLSRIIKDYYPKFKQYPEQTNKRLLIPKLVTLFQHASVWPNKQNASNLMYFQLSVDWQNISFESSCAGLSLTVIGKEQLNLLESWKKGLFRRRVISCPSVAVHRQLVAYVIIILMGVKGSQFREQTEHRHSSDPSHDIRG